MKDKINFDNDGYDPTEEYFNKKESDTYENETEEYFPQETSKPPHYQINKGRTELNLKLTNYLLPIWNERTFWIKS